MQRSNIINPVIATVVAEICTLPICTTKTVYQNSNSSSIKSTIRLMYNTNGLKAFYSATIPAIGSQVLSTTGKYYTYRYLQSSYQTYYGVPSGYHNMLFGCTSGIAVSLITHAVDNVKIHWQMASDTKKLREKKGLIGLYRGYSKTFWKTSIASAMFYPLYDYFRQTTPNAIVAAGLTSVISTTAMHPIDLLKTRHMYGLPYNFGLNFFQYYKGLGLNLIRIVPHFVITMTIIDYLEKPKRS